MASIVTSALSDRQFIGLPCCLAVCCLWATAAAQGLGLGAVTGARAHRQDALGAIPISQLTPDAARRIHDVVSQPSIYRRLPTRTIECDPQLFIFLVRNPEVVVDIWRLMGVTQLSFSRTGEFTFEASDGAGTDSRIELIYGRPDLHVFYGQGLYEGPLLKKRVHGECVLVLRNRFSQREGRPTCDSCLDVFLRVDPGAVELVAKTIQPLFGRAADLNFVQTAGFITRLSLTAENNGAGMQHLAQRLTNVSPGVRAQFASVASTVSERVGGETHQSPSASPPQALQVRPASTRPASPTALQEEPAPTHGPTHRVSRFPADSPRMR